MSTHLSDLNRLLLYYFSLSLSHSVNLSPSLSLLALHRPATLNEEKLRRLACFFPRDLEKDGGKCIYGGEYTEL